MSYLTVLTPPASEPLTLAQVRSHLRLDASGSPPTHPDDDYVGDLIELARSYAESYTERAIGTQTLRLTLDTWASAIRLPQSPVQSITGVYYRDASGVTQTVSADDYSLAGGDRPYLMLRAYPVHASTPDAVWIDYVAGFDDAVSPPVPLPRTMRQAMLLLIGHWYENREEAGNASSSGAPAGAMNLLHMSRVGMGL